MLKSELINIHKFASLDELKREIKQCIN
ncbi:hypothetical protein [Flavobacterium sp. DSR2-3-3]